MKNKRVHRLISAALAVVFMHGMAGSAEIARFEALSGLPFSENRPTPETVRTLRDELLFQRATQAYLWALPLINTLGMKVGSEKTFGAGYNVLPVWKKRLDAKTLVTTPNSDVIYAMGYVDLGKDGPLVFEAPPNLQGILLDAWQRPIPVDGGTFFGDVGLPGPDAGRRAHRTVENLSARRPGSRQADAVSRRLGCVGQYAADQRRDGLR